MKKLYSPFFLRTAFAVLLMLTFVRGWGQTITITQSSSGITATGYDSGAERTWTQNGVGFGAKAVLAVTSPANLQMQASNGVLYNTTPLPGKILSVTITNSSGTNTSTFSGGSTTRLVNATAGNYTVTGGTVVGSPSATGWAAADFTSTNYTYFAIKRGTGAANWSSVVINYEVPLCSGTPSAGSASVLPTSGSPGTDYLVSATGYSTDATGLSYQWQYNINGAGWSNTSPVNIPSSTSYANYNATDDVFAPAIGQSVQWRLVTTCSNGGASNTSSNATYTSVLSYCTPTQTTLNSVDTVENVSITNTLGANYSNAATGSSGYVYVNNLPAFNLVRSSTTNTIAITFGNDTTRWSGAWIDFNQNGTFEASEVIGMATSSTVASGTITYTFTVPAGALTGVTRLRVRGNADGSTNPYNVATGACVNTSYGDSEDYNVNIIVPSANPSLSISGTSNNHGTSCPAVAATPIAYTITNSGTGAANGVTVVSSDPQFVVSGLSSTTIAGSGGTATYNVTFTPSSAGAKTATITVASTTSGSNSPTSALTGTGNAVALGAVTTNGVGAITARSGVLNGTVTSVGSCPVISTRGFVISETATNATPTNAAIGVTTISVGGTTATAFASTPNNLLPSTQYSYRAYVLNGTTYTYGAPVNFTTLPALAVSGTLSHGSSCPAVAASPITYTITNNSAVTVTGITVSTNNPEFAVGGTPATSLLAGATTTYIVTFTPSSSGIMSATISTASSQPTISNMVTGTGNTPVTASVTTSAVTSNTTGTTATLNASASTLGVCPTTTTKGFVISKTSDSAAPTVGAPNVTNESVTPLGGNGAYSKAITGLTVNTDYSYRAYLYDGTTYTYGDVVTFMTPLVSSATDYFRSRQTGSTGNWNAAGSWDSSIDGITWIASTLVPNNNAKTITIRNGHTINVTSTVLADEVVIEATGILAITGSNTLEISNGAGDDLIVNGILRQSGATSILQRNSSATFIFNNGGTYESSRNDVYIPTATWHANSNCVIKGNVSTATYSQFNQTLGNLTWDAIQSANITLSNSVTTFKVAGTFELLNTNGWTFCFNSSTTEKNYEVGNLILRNDAMVELSNKSGGTDATNRHTYLKILGDLSLYDTSEIDFGYGTSDGPAYYGYPVRSVINLAGNLYASANSRLYIGGNNVSYGVINFDNTSEKTISILNPNTDSILFDVLSNSKIKVNSDITLDNFIDIYVDGVLDLGTHVISSASTKYNYFYTFPNSNLKIAHPEGIATFATFPTTGAVRVLGGEYDIDGNYVYYGTSNQITGNGLPEIIKSITVENTGTIGNNEVTLTNAELGVTDDLIVGNGIFNINDKEVYGGGVLTSELRVNTSSELKIGGTRSFPLDFGTVTFAPLSTVHYAGQDQTVANLNSTNYANLPSYENLKISGTGLKSPLSDLTVNNITTVTGGTLQIKETLDTVQPHVFTAKKGIQNTGGIVRLSDNANLLQDVDAINNGSIIAERKVTDMNNVYSGPTAQFDYVYWSSPVANQPITGAGAFSPGTAPEFFFDYKESDDLFYPTTDATFLRGKGYAVGAEVSTEFPASSTGYNQTYKFTGTPNNGTFTGQPLLRSATGGGYNLVGNPYPSNIDLDKLFALNSSRIASIAFMWSNTGYTENQMGSGYNKNNYSVYNLAGGTPATAYSYGFVAPSKMIKVGQGFIVESITNTQPLQFNNGIRDTDKGTGFYQKTSDIAKNRFWLQHISPAIVVNTMLVGYFDEATAGFDKNFDAELFSSPDDVIYSVLGSQKLVIQGKSIFNVDDKVSLGTNQNAAGNYTIKLAHKEGIFENGQAIYLHDKLNSTYTNLQETDFTYAAVKGATQNRFEIVYKSATLATDNNVKESLVVYKNGDSFTVKSKGSVIHQVEVYDASGRLLKSVKGNSNEIIIDASALSSGMYILNINRNNETINKKIIK